MERYVMVVKCWDDTEYTALATPHEIIDHIDMMDCTDEKIEVYKMQFGAQPKELYVCECWHNMNDPLYIKVVDEDGNIEFDGYGTDH